MLTDKKLQIHLLMCKDRGVDALPPLKHYLCTLGRMQSLGKIVWGDFNMAVGRGDIVSLYSVTSRPNKTTPHATVLNLVLPFKAPPLRVYGAIYQRHLSYSKGGESIETASIFWVFDSKNRKTENFQECDVLYTTYYLDLNKWLEAGGGTTF